MEADKGGMSVLMENRCCVFPSLPTVTLEAPAFRSLLHKHLKASYTAGLQQTCFQIHFFPQNVCLSMPGEPDGQGSELLGLLYWFPLHQANSIKLR